MKQISILKAATLVKSNPDLFGQQGRASARHADLTDDAATALLSNLSSPSRSVGVTHRPKEEPITATVELLPVASKPETAITTAAVRFPRARPWGIMP
ncbi:MAG: hypothetical protein HQL50_05515 [Magnetococcales bacterium]|nr:hypothetical protein [Magnetococcales bacterium]